jgi:hypothetical protein
MRTRGPRRTGTRAGQTTKLLTRTMGKLIPLVVEAGRAGAFVVRHLLRDLELAAVPQVFCDAGRAGERHVN